MFSTGEIIVLLGVAGLLIGRISRHLLTCAFMVPNVRYFLGLLLAALIDHAISMSWMQVQRSFQDWQEGQAG